MTDPEKPIFKLNVRWNAADDVEILLMNEHDAVFWMIIVNGNLIRRNVSLRPQQKIPPEVGA